MPDDFTEFPSKDWTEADRLTAVKLWWARVSPVPGSDEFFILQMVSRGAPGCGDPAAAREELLERGILASWDEHRSEYTEKAARSSWTFSIG